MNRMVYVLPETVEAAIIELFGVATTVAIILGCFIRNPTIDKYVHVILQRTNVLNPVSTDSDADPQSELYGVRVSRLFIYGLVLYITWVLFGAAIVFLDVFLIEVSNSCDPSASRANCFLNTGFFNISALYDKQLDCSNLNNLPDNTTYICYRYTLNLGVAFGTAGGYFGTGMLLLNLIAVLYVHQHPKKYCNIIKILHMCSGIILCILTAVVVHAVPQLRHILTEGSLIAMLHFIHLVISQILVHALFMLPVSNIKRTSKKAYDYKTGTENVPGATQSTDIPMTTLPHESQEESSVSVYETQNLKSAYGHDQPIHKRETN